MNEKQVDVKKLLEDYKKLYMLTYSHSTICSKLQEQSQDGRYGRPVANYEISKLIMHLAIKSLCEPLKEN